MNRNRYSQRSSIVVGLMLLLFSLLIWRLIDLQVVQGKTYTAKAENNRFYSQRLNSRRGVLLDRYQQPLVLNNSKYYQIVNPGALYEKKVPLTRDDALQIMASSQSATVIFDTQRSYLYPQSLAHVLGYVGPVTADDLRRDSTLQADQQIGKAGLELQYEKQLHGVDGKEIFEVNAVGRKLRQLKVEPAQAGQDVVTSLDPYLTEVANRALGTQRGSVIITDAKTGKILVMTSTPSFDPNPLSQNFIDPDQEAQRQEKVRSFFADPQNVFFNRAVAGAYPPGSIFKLAVSLAGLESGKIDQNTQVVDEGKIKVGTYEFGNWYFRQYGKVEGSLGLVRAITRSNDIFFYKVAEWTGPDTLAAMARVFGLGEKTGIDLPGEAKGIIPDPSWKDQVKGEKWFLGDTYHMGIGQGDTLTTPIQIAQMTQAIANQGSLCKVSLNESAQPECRQVTVKPNDMNLVLHGMLGVCSAGGTAFPFFPYNQKKLPAPIPDQKVEQAIDAGAIGCKTGTAEFGYADEKGNRKTHGWFTAIIGLPNHPGLTATSATKPDQLHDDWLKKSSQQSFPKRITITVLVESDDANPFKEGSKDAAPVAKQIVDWLTQ